MSLRDHLMREELASSVSLASRRPPFRVVAPVASQRPAGQSSRAMSQPTRNGPLAAARELLRNLPGAVASPDAQRQWRDDVDRLLSLAQVTPGSAGESVSRQRRRQGGASGSVHSPTVRSARTEELRIEDLVLRRILNREGVTQALPQLGGPLQGVKGVPTRICSHKLRRRASNYTIHGILNTSVSFILKGLAENKSFPL
jgi:hypothetical protein